MIKRESMDEDEVGYVGLIRESISYIEDIRTMQVSFKTTLIYLGVDKPGPNKCRL
jgi:hypothetical protein